MIKRIGHGNSFFPGASGLGGCENREDIRPLREEHYLEAIKAASKLVQRHELEDLAIENRRIALKNAANASLAQRYFPDYDPTTEAHQGLGTALSSLLSGDVKPGRTPPRCIKPAKFECAPANLAVAMSLPQADWAQHAALLDDVLRSMPESQRGRVATNQCEQWESAATSALARSDARQQSKDLFLRGLRSLVAAPLLGSEVEREVERRVLACAVLLRAASESHEPQSEEAVFTMVDNLLLKADSDAISDYEIQLIQSSLAVVTHYARTSDSAWNRLKQLLLRELKAGRTGPVDSEGYGKGLFFEALSHIPERLGDDIPLLEQVERYIARDVAIEVPESSDEDEKQHHISNYALRAVAPLETERSFGHLMRALLRDQNVEWGIKLLSWSKDDLTTLDPRPALQGLQFDREPLYERHCGDHAPERRSEVDAKLDSLDQRLERITSFSDLLGTVFSKALAFDNYQHRCIYLLRAYFEVAERIQSKLVKSMMEELLAHERLTQGDLEEVLRYVVEQRIDLSTSSLARSFATAKGEYRDDLEKVLRILEQDLQCPREVIVRHFRAAISDRQRRSEPLPANAIIKAQLLGLPQEAAKVYEDLLASESGTTRLWALKGIQGADDGIVELLSGDAIRRMIFLLRANRVIITIEPTSNYAGVKEVRISEAKVVKHTLVALASGSADTLVRSIILAELRAPNNSEGDSETEQAVRDFFVRLVGFSALGRQEKVEAASKKVRSVWDLAPIIDELSLADFRILLESYRSRETTDTEQLGRIPSAVSERVKKSEDLLADLERVAPLSDQEVEAMMSVATQIRIER
jgi:hypothetical protein